LNEDESNIKDLFFTSGTKSTERWSLSWTSIFTAHSYSFIE
jgi:hypothetical protein